MLKAAIPLVALLISAPTAAPEPPALSPSQDPDWSAERIWAVGPARRTPNQVWFRTRFELPKGVQGARILVSCDNASTVYLDGQRVGASDDWQVLTAIDLDQPAAGEHALALQGVNQGGPAGLVAWIVWTDAAGTRHVHGTGPKWLTSLQKADGWTQPKFDDSGWAAPAIQGLVPFRHTLYGSKPRRIDVISRLTRAILNAESALEALRDADTDAAALQALDALDRAAIDARASVLERRRRKR